MNVCNSLFLRRSLLACGLRPQKFCDSGVPGNEGKGNTEKGRGYLDLYNKELNQRGQRQWTLEKLRVEQSGCLWKIQKERERKREGGREEWRKEGRVGWKGGKTSTKIPSQNWERTSAGLRSFWGIPLGWLSAQGSLTYWMSWDGCSGKGRGSAASGDVTSPAAVSDSRLLTATHPALGPSVQLFVPAAVPSTHTTIPQTPPPSFK